MEESRETSSSSNNSSEELSSALQLSKGMSIFLDILRRADKNDDGKLSFEEFKAYFADGVLSGEELHELFHTIDTHNTNACRVQTDALNGDMMEPLLLHSSSL